MLLGPLRRAHAVWLLGLGLLVAGCAVQYRGADGRRHVVGLVHVSTREIADDRAEIVAQEVATIGAAFLFLPEHAGIAVGYTRNFSIQVNDRAGVGELSIPMSDPTAVRFRSLREVVRGMSHE